ncbi:substrate-binding domain-containing protein [Mediterraneibacter agrestimuris]|uniref:substrate-binding domain-containing protein n=1 Tax=Mediterraneibacter agrestimuris TaxID=2941333 RepID=UPI002040B083|nr:substrate-binding domain-containing protein [Mediterraneibacter agrestimuris]
MRFFRSNKLLAPVMAAAMIFAAAGCAEEEKKPTFTGDTTEEPAYQTNLNEISPTAYSEVRGLNLEPGTYISIIGKDETAAFWKNVEKGAMQAAEDLNEELGYTGGDKIKVVYNAPAKSGDIDEQVNILDEELARYPDVIGISSIDEDACTVQFDLATENGIPVIALDSGNNYPGIQCTVKTDNQDAAKTGAYKLADAMEREGSVLLLVHDSKSETAKERTVSFQAEIQENYPEVKIAETIYFDKMDELKKSIVEETQPELQEEERLSAAEKMSDEEVILHYLEKYPEVKGIFGTNDLTTQLAVSVLKEAKEKKDIMVMGFDAGEEQLQALRDGEIAGLVVQNPFAIGYASVIAAARTVLEAGNEAVVTTGYTWVTKENLESESIQKMLYK